jgi:hypothetical protein
LKKPIFIFILAFILIISLLTACNKDAVASIEEVDIKNIKNEELRNLIDSWQQEDGAYLANNIIGGAYYLFLNASTVEEGEKPTYFQALSVGFESNVMHIYYVEKELGEIKNNRNKILYRIPMEGTPDSIKIFKNGEEVYFNNIGVIKGK